MQFAELEINPVIPPWNTVIELADELPTGSWMLVGGLMTQAHAMLARYESRATKDIDVLIDVMSSSANIPPYPLSHSHTTTTSAFHLPIRTVRNKRVKPI